jgi:hypothetical protein
MVNNLLSCFMFSVVGLWYWLVMNRFVEAKDFDTREIESVESEE